MDIGFHWVGRCTWKPAFLLRQKDFRFFEGLVCWGSFLCHISTNDTVFLNFQVKIPQYWKKKVCWRALSLSLLVRGVKGTQIIRISTSWDSRKLERWFSFLTHFWKSLTFKNRPNPSFVHETCHFNDFIWENSVQGVQGWSWEIVYYTFNMATFLHGIYNMNYWPRWLLWFTRYFQKIKISVERFLKMS